MNAYAHPTEPRPISRRTVIIQAGLAAAALAGLTSCTNYGAQPASSSAPADSAASALTVKKAEVPLGSGAIFSDARAVVTQPTADEFKAFTSICTHAQCPLASVTETINCNCHGSRFSISDGSVVNGPATQPLAGKAVTVEGDSLTIT